MIGRSAAAAVTIIEAPGGFGKSTLINQIVGHADRIAVGVMVEPGCETEHFVAALIRSLRRAGQIDIANSLANSSADTDAWSAGQLLDDAIRRDPDRLLLIVDEAQHLAESSVEWLARLLDGVPAHARVVVAGRRVHSALTLDAGAGGRCLLSTDDLRYTDTELVEALTMARADRPEDDELRSIARATGGWPAAVAVVAGHSAMPGRRTSASTLAALSADALMRRLIHDLLLPSSPEVRSACGALAHLPLLSPDVADVVGGAGALSTLIDAGIPVSERSDGWLEIADPIRDVLTEMGALSSEARRSVASAYAQRGELAESVAMLAAAGDEHGLCDVLASQPRAALIALGAPTISIVADMIGDEAMADHADVLVSFARALEEVDDELRRDCMQRADRVLTEPGPSRRSLDAERARSLVRVGEFTAAIELCTDVLGAATGTETLTRARAYHSRALAMIISDTARSAAAALRDFERAVQLYRIAGETRWEANTLMMIGFGIHLPAGELELAEERVGNAVGLLAGADRQRANVLTYHGETLAQLGRLDDAEAALAEASAIGRRLLDEQTLGYAAWTSMQVALLRRDRAAAVAWMDEAMRHPADWYNNQAGTEFLCWCCEVHSHFDEPAHAEAYLATAESRESSSRDDLVTYTRAAFEARFGSAARALELLEFVDHSSTLYPRDRWLRLLLRALCHHRLGDEPQAVSLRRQSEIAAAAIGDPLRAQRTESEILARLGVAGAVDVQPSTRVVLLGGFRVVRGSDDVTPVAGHPATFVKLLALRRSMTVDEAVDALWPDADLTTGRTRVRNLLHRIRTTSGAVIDRREESLVLAADVDVDASGFEKDVALALGAPLAQRAGLARRALQRYGGDLLPGDLYVDAFVQVRERLRRQHLAMLDLVADDSLRRGDIDEALRLLDEAILAEPGEESRYLSAAQGLVAQGRRRSALALLERSAAVSDELGLEPSRRLRELLDSLA